MVVQAAVVARASYFSKEDYTNYRRCAGYAWLVRRQPQVIPVESDPGAIRRANAGDEIAIVARDLYPDGVPIETADVAEAVRLTRLAIDGGASTIFNATVLTGRGVVARADILTRVGGQWALGEVKAATSIKSEHIVDAAFQAVVFTRAGFDLTGVRLVHLSRAYRRSGSPSAAQMLVSTDVTERVKRRLAATASEIEMARRALGDPETPGVCLCDMGTRGARCPTFALFHPGWPSGDTIYDLGSVNKKTIGEVIARGVVRLADWPDDIPLLPRQRLQIDVLRSGEAYVDRRRIRHLLDRLRFPLHFLDYETFQTAVPAFDGCAPWAQVPFQYSLHVVEADGSIAHREFLWTDRHACPVPALVRQLRQEIGPEGSVIVWNQPFESARNREMAELVPEAAGYLLDMNGRMIDLMDVVKKGWWVHPAFNGSASIKKVLPVVAAELAYEFLDIGDGAMASERWFEAVMGDPNALTDDDRESVFAALRIYCRRDTEALIRILRRLESLVEGPCAHATSAVG